MATVQAALHFINEQHHGYLAFPTEDGLVFRSEMVLGDNITRYYEDGDDNWCEELEVFPVVNGEVSIRAIKDHMGY